MLLNIENINIPGNVRVIKWTTVDWLDPDGGALQVNIELTRDNGSNWETINSAAPNTGYYLWNVTGPGTTQAKIRLSDLTDPTINFVGSQFIITNITPVGSMQLQIV